MRASRLIVVGLLATAGGALMARPAAADIVIGDETMPLQAAVCVDVPLLSDLPIGVGLGVAEPCRRALGDETPALQAAVCVDAPSVLDLQADLALAVAEPCPRALDDEVAPPPPEVPPPPAPGPVPAAAGPTPVVRSIATPRAVEPAPLAAPPIVAPTEPEPLATGTIRSHRSTTLPTPPPNPFGSTVALVVIAAAVAGGTNVLFRGTSRLIER